MADQHTQLYFAIIPFGALAWLIFRPRYLLRKWAAANDYEILRIGNSFFWQNTFPHTWRRHMDYRLKVRDRDGKVRQCNIRIIDALGWQLEEKINVEWIDMP